MTDNSSYVTATLACGHPHTTTLANLMHTVAPLCFACKQHIPWMIFTPMDRGWSLKCTRCRYQRAFGDSPLTAKVKATAHAVKKHHRVLLTCDGTTVDTIDSKDTVLSNDPPF